MASRVKIDGQAPDDLTGTMSMVGVVDAPLSVLDALWYRFDDDVTLYQRLPGVVERAQRRDAKDAIALSKEIAPAVAYTLLGEDVIISGDGAIVRGVSPTGPSQGHLERDDVIVKAGSQRIATEADLVGYLRAVGPDALVPLTLRRKGLPVRTTVKTTAAPGDPTRGVLGINVSTDDLSITLPSDVKFATGTTSGPSAGLALALTVFDEESPLNLLQGDNVVATGEVSLAGDVIEVGAIRQKALAAQQAGAQIMIVPRVNQTEALAAIRSACGEEQRCTRVIGVRTVQEAVEALRVRSDSSSPIDQPTVTA